MSAEATVTSAPRRDGVEGAAAGATDGSGSGGSASSRYSAGGSASPVT